MPEHAGAKNREENRTISRWLFNPFYYVAGIKALITGVGILVLTGVFAFCGKVRFDGLLDFHMGLPPAPLWINIAEQLLSWLLFGTLLLLAGKIVSKSRPRAIDVFGTQALARLPYLFASLTTLIPGAGRFAGELVVGRASFDHFSKDMVVFLFVVVFGMLMLVWMVTLMYRAFAVSCNVSGKVAIWTFIFVLIVGEIISKVLLLRLFPFH